MVTGSPCATSNSKPHSFFLLGRSTRTSARLGTWRVTRWLTRKWHDCPHTNATTNATCEARQPAGEGPRVVVSTAALHARVRGSVPGLGGLKETKILLPHPRVKFSIVGSLRDREVAFSTSDRQGSNFESCVSRTVSSHSSHHPQEVFLAQFSLYVHKGGLKPDLFHYICDNGRDENVTFLKMVALPIALAYVVALVRFGNDQIMCLKNWRDVIWSWQSRHQFQLYRNDCMYV